MTPDEIEIAANLGRAGLLVDVRPLSRFLGCVVESWLLPWGTAEVRYNWYDFEEEQLRDEGEIVFRAEYESVLLAAQAMSRNLERPFESWRNLAVSGWGADRSDGPACAEAPSGGEAYLRLLSDFNAQYPPLPDGEWHLVR